MIIVLLGAPGAGKGTQADKIHDALSLPIISTGNLLREAIASGSDLGKLAASFMDGGGLVPDELIIDLVKEKLSMPEYNGGCILDGFPRTVQQAEALGKAVDIDVALSIEVPDEVIEERMVGRRTCPKCQTTFHIKSNPPKKEGVCDKCGTTLGIRHDDELEVVDRRLHIYHQLTVHVKEYYRARGTLKEVHGQGTIAATTELVFKALGIEL